VTYGTLISEAISTKDKLKSDGIDVAVIKLEQIFPLPEKFIETLMNFDNVFFFEEGILNGGIAEKTGFELITNGFEGKYFATAITGFVKQASVGSQREKYGLDSNSMYQKIKEVL
jgi:1-deoxy-D-xylulose-5-phosphate synthase